MKEVITSILQAEKQGEELVKDALLEAKEILLSAEGEKENLKRNNEQTIKQMVSYEMRNAEKMATEDYNKVIAVAKEECEKFIENNKNKTKELETIIVRRIVSTYGSR